MLEPQRIQQVTRQLEGGRMGLGDRCPALGEWPAGEAGGGGGRQQGADTHGAGGFADHAHPARIPTEGGDVVVDPGERRDLVEQPRVGTPGEPIAPDRGQVEVAEHPQAELTVTTTTSPRAASAAPSYHAIEPEPLRKDPPWIQTSTGRAAAARWASSGAQTLRVRQSSDMGAGMPRSSSSTVGTCMATGP